ncbi:MAG: hypothetical protein J6V12_07215 [Bacteroidaceae bacterium]|nr:hypothetical protein [Bacteroidaceae bacterium]
MNISAIDSLEAIVDGDTVVPGMNFVLPAGVGTTQYYSPSTGICTPNYSDKPITLYPYCYSSRTGKFLVPSSENMMWYLNDPESSSAQILASKGGTVVDKYKDRFELTSYTVNNQTFPALKIKGNLASADNLNDVVIYFKSTFNEMEVTCHGDISVKESVGEMFDILINCVNEQGISDTVIDNSSEYLLLSASLLNCGEPAAPTGEWSWMRATSNGLVAVSHVPGVSEFGDKSQILKLYEAAIEGTEEYFACVTHNGSDYKKGIQVCDTHDPYYINVGRSQVGNLVKQSDSITYTPQVLSRSTGSIQSGWSFAFVARDNDGRVVRSSSGSTFSVEGAEVHEYGGLNIHISASKS